MLLFPLSIKPTKIFLIRSDFSFPEKWMNCRIVPIHVSYPALYYKKSLRVLLFFSIYLLQIKLVTNIIDSGISSKLVSCNRRFVRVTLSKTKNMKMDPFIDWLFDVYKILFEWVELDISELSVSRFLTFDKQQDLSNVIFKKSINFAIYVAL